MIEQHIHQIWIQGESHLPEKLRANMNMIISMHNINNGWRYTLWDEIEIIRLMKIVTFVFLKVTFIWI